MGQGGSQEKQKNILTIHSDSWLLTPDSLPRRGDQDKDTVKAGYDVSDSLDAGFTLKDFQAAVSTQFRQIGDAPQRPSVMDFNKGSPHQQQAQRTVTVAKILCDFLNCKETSHYSGERYTATWDKTSKTLSLVSNSKNQLLMLAQYDQGSWKPLPVPLTDNSPNLTDADLNHFEYLAPKIQKTLQKRSQQDRQWEWPLIVQREGYP